MPQSEDLERMSKRERRYLRDLTPHPDSRVFAEPLEHEISTLAYDIQARELQHPIEISPAGVIIAGRRRWLALQQLGHESTICVVRHDLAALGEIAIVEYLVKDNIIRRNHTAMEVARGHQVVEFNHGSFGITTERSYRDAVAQHLNLSDAELSQLCRAVTTPRVIQDAVDAGSMRLADAARVSLMSLAIQDAIACEIVHDAPLEEVLRRYCGHSAKAEAADNVPAEIGSIVQRAAAELAGCAADLLACDNSAQSPGQASRKTIANVVRRLTALLRQS